MYAVADLDAWADQRSFFKSTRWNMQGIEADGSVRLATLRK